MLHVTNVTCYIFPDSIDRFACSQIVCPLVLHEPKRIVILAVEMVDEPKVQVVTSLGKRPEGPTCP